MLKAYASIWSNDKATEMAKFYKSIFKGTKIGKTAYWASNPMAPWASRRVRYSLNTSPSWAKKSCS